MTAVSHWDKWQSLISIREKAKKETSVKIKLLLSVGLILIICVTGGFVGCTNEKAGAFPQFSIGDKWVSRWNTQGMEYTVTAEITGEEAVDGKDCWVMETTYEPPYKETVISTTNKYDKTNLDIVSSDYHTTKTGQITTITYKIGGTPYYPLKVGKESEEIAFQTLTSGNTTISWTENSTVTTKTVVEKMEKITVAAGTFNCFKVLKYDENGNLTQITWRPDETKLFQVKMTDMSEEDAIYELISYSVK